MASKAVELSVAGHSCRVVTTADEQELEALVAMVENKLLNILAPGRPLTTQAMLLVAVALANDVREERARRDAAITSAKRSLTSIVARVDDALGSAGSCPEPRDPAARSVSDDVVLRSEHPRHREGQRTLGTPRTPGSTAGPSRTPLPGTHGGSTTPRGPERGGRG